jgi:hypothetical protein
MFTAILMVTFGHAGVEISFEKLSLEWRPDRDSVTRMLRVNASGWVFGNSRGGHTTYGTAWTQMIVVEAQWEVEWQMGSRLVLRVNRLRLRLKRDTDRLLPYRESVSQ